MLRSSSFFRLLTFYIVGVALLYSGASRAQRLDDFSDGEFKQNPGWQGDDSLFVVNSAGQLQLDDPTPSTQTAHLAVGQQLQAGTNEWRFFAELDFAPSTSNFLKFYLLSDASDLGGSLDGYFIRIGQSGSDDGVELYRQDGNTETLLLSGPTGTLASGGAFRIRVLRDAQGSWEIFLDAGNQGAFTSQGTVTDNQHGSGAFAGIFCSYTSTRSDRFFFDDISVPFPDTTPPGVASASFSSATALQVVFSEEVTAASGLDAGNYRLEGRQYALSNLRFAGNRRDTVRMEVSPAVPANRLLDLRVQDVEDGASNQLRDTTLEVIRTEIGPGDLVLNEFLADPTPSQGLPEAEFVEIYNRLAIPVSLEGWSLADGSGAATLPAAEIGPQSYLILCDEADTAAFQAFGPTLGFDPPALNNGGDALRLLDAEGREIDGLVYDDAWYTDPGKASGGFSLERIDPTTACGGRDNWRGTLAQNGGTPGQPNSVLDSTPDTRPPRLAFLRIASPTTLRLAFDETMDSASVAQASISFSPAVQLDGREVRGPQFDTLILRLAAPLSDQVRYNLRLENLADCPGNVAASLDTSFTYREAQTAAAYDILIHELTPEPDGRTSLPEVEYVELINRSDKPVELQGWTLSDATGSVVLERPYLLLGGAVVVVVDEDDAVEMDGFGPLYEVNGLPSLNNSGDELALRNASGRLIHYLPYDDAWYADDFRAQGGYALEMVDTANPCGGAENWRASADESGGTPGAANSVAGTSRDSLPPRLLRLTVPAADSVVLFLSESLDSALTAAQLNVELLPGDLVLEDFKIIGPAFDRISLRLETPLTSRVAFQIRLDSLFDCAGNLNITSRSLDLGLPEPVAAGDVRINELLSNPETGGSDFVELYNASPKILDLGALSLATRDENGNIDDPEQIDESGLLLFPGQYLALSEDTGFLRRTYPAAVPQHLFQMDDLPSYGDDSGLVLLLNERGLALEEFPYREENHLSLLPNTEGYSLERRHPSLPVDSAGSWISATTAAGKATPGAPNSVLRNPDSLDAPFPFDAQRLAINEVLYNPPENGADFVELFHAGDAPIDLADFFLLRIDPEDGDTLQQALLAETSRPVAQGSYIVLIEDSLPLVENGFTPDTNHALVEMDLPTLPATSPTRLVVVSRSQRPQEAFTFSDSLQLPLLGSANKGFALERLHPDLPVADARSWTSARIAFGRATLGQQNSVFRLPEDTGVLQPIDERPLRISELLFDPVSGSSDYVELYHAGEAPIELADYFLARVELATDSLLDAAPLVAAPTMLQPGAYAAFSASAQDILAQYEVRFPERLYEAEDLPNFPSSGDGGKLALYSHNQVVLEDFRYSEDLHLPLLNETKGVALERIDFEAATTNPDNWQSASENFGFGTPTFRNSQQVSSEQDEQDAFYLEEDIFSPDGDGFQDNLIIRYQLDRGDRLATMRIYDLNGQLVTTLREGFVLGREGLIRWDGVTDRGERASVGIYILMIETYGTQGSDARFKIPFTLAGRL